MVRIVSRSPEETEEAGFTLGRSLKSRGGAATVYLFGDLGAGKTTLIKGIASAFGIPPRNIGSASFVIVAEYETDPPFYHIDLYRVEREEDLDALGIWEYIDTGGVAVIEWAERLPEIPGDAVTVRLTYCDHGREIIIEGITEDELSGRRP
ncbi:MAG: tRNA (adenosine(37)-N6)-threonylcarbamoyltransferase complex ATPase subunit type 1 TsaE [Nitrospirota bacterium]